MTYDCLDIRTKHVRNYDDVAQIHINLFLVVIEGRYSPDGPGSKTGVRDLPLGPTQPPMRLIPCVFPSATSCLGI